MTPGKVRKALFPLGPWELGSRLRTVTPQMALWRMFLRSPKGRVFKQFGLKKNQLQKHFLKIFAEIEVAIRKNPLLPTFDRKRKVLRFQNINNPPGLHSGGEGLGGVDVAVVNRNLGRKLTEEKGKGCLDGVPRRSCRWGRSGRRGELGNTRRRMGRSSGGWALAGGPAA